MHARLRFRYVIGLASVLAAAVALPPAEADAATNPLQNRTGPIAVHGTWTDSEPLTIVSERLLGADVLLTARGSSSWSGTMAGTTQFTIRAIIDPSGRGVGTIDETFVGTVSGAGYGQVHFIEAAVQSPSGALRITAITTSGAGDLSGLRGLVQFVGSTDATGVGGGSYSGAVAR